MYLDVYLIRFWGVAVGRRRFRPVLHATDGATWRWPALCSVDRTRTRRSTHTVNSTTETRTDVNACKDAIILCVFTPAFPCHHDHRASPTPSGPHRPPPPQPALRPRSGPTRAVRGDSIRFPPRSPRPGLQRKSRTATTARRDWISGDRFVSLEFGLTGLLPLWQDSLTSTH